MAQKLQGGDAELAFFGIDYQAVLAEAEEQLPEVMLVLLHTSAADKNIVQVAEDFAQAGQHGVHVVLKSIASIPQSEGHPQIFEETERC